MSYDIITNNCRECEQDTSAGSGRFVNRCPADWFLSDIDENIEPNSPQDKYVDGYICDECMIKMEREVYRG